MESPENPGRFSHTRWSRRQRHSLEPHTATLVGAVIGHTCWSPTRRHLLEPSFVTLVGAVIRHTCWSPTRRHLLEPSLVTLVGAPHGDTCWSRHWSHLLEPHTATLVGAVIGHRRFKPDVPGCRVLDPACHWPRVTNQKSLLPFLEFSSEWDGSRLLPFHPALIR